MSMSYMDCLADQPPDQTSCDRNCDHYKTPEEAYDAWGKFCTAHYDDNVYEGCKTCPLDKGKGGCFGKFLYAEYKPEATK